MFSQLAKQSARVLPADLCTDHANYVKNHRPTVLRRNKNMTVQGGTVSHHHILVIRKFIDFMSLFRHSMRFSFSVKQFPSAEFGIWFATYSCVYLIRTAEELSYRAVFCCKPYRKVKVSSRNRAFSSCCDLFIAIALNFNVEFKELTDRNKRSETLWSVNVCSGMYDMYGCKLIFIRLWVLNILTSEKFDTLSSNFYQHHNFSYLLMSSPGKNDVTYKDL